MSENIGGGATPVVSAAILELDRDGNQHPGYFAAVLVRQTPQQVRAVSEVRGTTSHILKGDYYAEPQGDHTVYVRSDDSRQKGTIYLLTPLR